MSKSSKRLKLKLALPWNEFIGPPQLDDESLITNWRCSNRDFARFANRSRIVLTLPRFFSAVSEQFAAGSTPPPRLFETALAGGFQIVASPELDFATYYEPDEEILSCADDDVAIAAITEMLEDPARRLAMAERARARTARENLYDHRVQKILEITCGSLHSSRALKKSERKKVVLFVAHNRLGEIQHGGIEIYQESIGKALTRYEVMFLFPTVRDGGTVLCLQGDGIAREFTCKTMNPKLLCDDQIENIFSEILFTYEVDIVHFHHLLNLPMSFSLIAKSCGLPIIWQIHDYYLICEHYNLLTIGDRFCDVAYKGTAQCDACLGAMDGLQPGTKARREAFAALIVRAVDAFIASTPYSADYFRRFFPEIGPDIVKIVGLPAVAAGAYNAEAVQNNSGNEKTPSSRDPGQFFHTQRGGDYRGGNPAKPGLSYRVQNSRAAPRAFRTTPAIDDEPRPHRNYQWLR